MASHRKGPAQHRYCVVQVRTWDDEKVRRLSQPGPNARDLWLYLLCGPFTTRVPGVVSGGRAAMAEALGWPLQDFERCFAEIEAQKLAVADWEVRLVYLPSAFEQPENTPSSPSTAATWKRELANLPACALRTRISRDLRAALRGMHPAFLGSFDLGRRSEFQARGELAPISSSSQDDLGSESAQSQVEVAAQVAESADTGFGSWTSRQTTEVRAASGVTREQPATQVARQAAVLPGVHLAPAPAPSPALAPALYKTPPTPQGGIAEGAPPPLMLTNPETPAARQRDRGERKSKRGQVALEVQQQALRVLEALNVARQRVGFKGRGLGPIPANLGEITARLAEGTAVEDCLHVVSVCEFECQRPGEAGATARQYFDAVTPFRPQNFARKLGRQVDQKQQGQWQQDAELTRLWDGDDDR